MKARVLQEQADFFEVAVLSLTADVQSVSAEQLLSAPSGPPLVVVGGLLTPERLADMREFSAVLARAGTSVLVAPPFADIDLGRYFETPVQLLVQRRAAESTAHVVDATAAAVVGEEAKIRSDHFFDTALGAGAIAVDVQGKAVLIRYQASNTQGPVFFSALQLLSYTALTDESQRQRLLAHLLAWLPAVASKPIAQMSDTGVDRKGSVVAENTLVPIALLLAAGGAQTEDQLRTRAHAHLGADLSADDVSRALEELSREGLVELDSTRLNSVGTEVLNGFLEQRGLHPYVRELEYLLTTGEADA